ncbi:MAG: hypothetical protein M1831_003202 [Alyxoria varia]|nr:MAG: hypothetical protein M1831_003202 [Alyxoria varia]
MDFRTALLELEPPSRGPVKPHGSSKQSKVAARRDAPPLPFIKTPQQDSSQQDSAPRKPQAFTPHPSPHPIQPNSNPSDGSAGTEETDPPLKPAKSTKSSLFNLFSKPNVEQARGYHETNLESPQTPNIPPPHNASRRASLKPLPAPPKPARASSITSTKSTPSRRRSFKPSAGHRPKQDSNGNIPCQLAANWEPPPLLQAYPQALRHCLMRDPDNCFETYAPGTELNEGETLRSRPGTPHKSRASTASKRKDMESRGSDTSGELCGPAKQNIYILVTSGYILQYAGDGPCERKPQKILKLCAESAAFASDLIPGKPYVLQVLQKPDDSNINVYAPKKSLLSKVISASHLPKRRYTRSMILVFSDPNEMNGWMESIRKEVDRLSGRRKRPATTAHHAASDKAAQPNLGPQRVITLTRKSSMESRSQVSPLKSPPLSPTTNVSEGMSGTTAVGTSSEWSSTSSLRHPYASIRGRQGNHGPQISTDQVQKRPYDIALPSPARIEVTRSSTSVSPKKFDPDTYQMPDLCPVRSCESISTAFTDAPSESSTLGGTYHTPMSTPAMDAYSKILARRTKKNASKESNDNEVDINAVPDSATLGGPNNAAWHPNVACASPGTSRPPSVLMSPKSSPPRRSSRAKINPRTSSRYFEQRAPETTSSATPSIPRSHPPLGNAFAQQVYSKSSDNLTQRPQSRVIPPALPLRRSFQSTQEAQLPQSQTFSGRRAIRSPAPLPLHATAPKRTSTYFQNSQPSSPIETRSAQPSPLKSLPEAEKTEFGLGINMNNPNSLAPPNDDSQSHRASTLSRLSGEETPSRSSSKRNSLVSASTRKANGTEPSPGSEARPLRRPNSILIKPDPVPLLAKRQSNTGLQMTIPISGMGSDAIFATAGRASRRTSTRVPVVRPPSVARAPNGLRFSRSTPALPPAQPPPAVPLPPPPPQASQQQAVK